MELPIEEKNKRRMIFKFWDRERDIRVFKWAVVAIIIVIFLVIVADPMAKIKNDIVSRFSPDLLDQNSSDQDDSNQDTPVYNFDSQGIQGGDCNVQGIELHGDMVTYISPADKDTDDNATVDQTASENVSYAINQAEKNSKIKAIILEVDSYGGFGVPAEEISNALKQAKKPTVALIRQGGVSAAYFAATGADRIFASKYSDIGGIGVTMSYLDNASQNQKEGLTYNQLSSGKFKDTGDPDKKLSAEEINLLMRDVNIMHQNFIKAVAENRGLDIEKVRKLADGSTMMGEMALQNDLIDKIGGMFEVKEYLKEKIGEDVEVCW